MDFCFTYHITTFILMRGACSIPSISITENFGHSRMRLQMDILTEGEVHYILFSCNDIFFFTCRVYGFKYLKCYTFLIVLNSRNVDPRGVDF